MHGLLGKIDYDYEETPITREIKEYEVDDIVDEAKKGLFPIIEEWFKLLQETCSEPSYAACQEELRKQYQQFVEWLGD